MICRWEVVNGFSMQHRPHVCSLATWFDKNLVCKSGRWMPVKSNHHWHVFAAESGNICQTVRVLWSICCRWSSFASKTLLYSFWRKGLDWMWLDEDECRYLSFTLCWFRFFVPVGHCNDLYLLGCFLLWIAWIIPPMLGLMVVIHGSEGSSPLHTCLVEPTGRHGSATAGICGYRVALWSSICHSTRIRGWWHWGIEPTRSSGSCWDIWSRRGAPVWA